MQVQKVLFSAKECQDILSYFNDWVESKIYTHLDKPAVPKPKFRKSYHSVESFDSSSFIYNRYKDFLEENDILLTAKEIKLMAIRYKKGDYLKRHNDVHPVYKRRYAVISQLSDDSFYSGGDFLFFDSNDTKVYFNRKIGNSTFFAVNTDHQVTEVTDGIRYSLIFFLCEGEFISKKQTLI